MNIAMVYKSRSFFFCGSIRVPEGTEPYVYYTSALTILSNVLFSLVLVLQKSNSLNPYADVVQCQALNVLRPCGCVVVLAVTGRARCWERMRRYVVVRCWILGVRAMRQGRGARA